MTSADDDVRTCINSLFLNERESVTIIDSGADTCILGKAWQVLAENPTRRANVVGFDHKASVKRNLAIVTAVTAVDIDDKTYLLQINEAVFNSYAEHSLLSEFQMRKHGIKIDSVPLRHGGNQQMIVQDQVIPFGVMDCLTYFRTRLPTNTELYDFKPLVLTQEGVPWRPRHSDFQSPVNDAFNKEVLAAARADAEAESNNFASNNTTVHNCSLHSPVSAYPREQGEI